MKRVILLVSQILVVSLSKGVENDELSLKSAVGDNLVYFDRLWKPLPLLQSSHATNLKSDQLTFGSLPCTCQELTCGCCANMNFFSSNRTGCMNMVYDPYEFSIGLDMLMNGESIYKNSVSAKNPPPACMEAPIPYLPSVQFCIKLFEIYTPGRNLHMCINFETRIVRAPVLVLEFDCVQMGSDGLSHLKPGNNTVQIANSTST